MLINGDQQIADQCGQYLDPHRILATPEEVFDAQMLLDPLEEQLNLPTIFVVLGDDQRTAHQVVRRQYQRGGFVRPGDANVPERLAV